MNKQLYLEARNTNDPQFRQEFLDSIELGKLSKYVNKLVYRPELKGEKDTLFQCSWVSPGEKTYIFGLPQIFNHNNFTLTDIKGCLFYHEGQHAKDVFECDDSVISFRVARTLVEHDLENFYYSLTELRALENQCINLPKMNFSEYYKKTLLKYGNYFANIVKDLKEEIPESDFRMIEYEAQKIKKRIMRK